MKNNKLRKKIAKKYKFNPLRKNSSQSSQEQIQQQIPSQTFYAKLTNQSQTIRTEATLILVNITFIPPQLQNKQVLNQLVLRIMDQKLSIAYNTLYAIKNLIEIDKRILNNLFELGLLKLMVSLLKKIVSNTDQNLSKKLLEASFILLLSLFELCSYEELKVIEKFEESEFFIDYIMNVLILSQTMHNCQIIFQILVIIVENTNLNIIVSNYQKKHNIIQKIFMSRKQNKIKALSIYCLLFCSQNLNEFTLKAILQFYDQIINTLNLEIEFQNISLKQEKVIQEQEQNDEQIQNQMKQEEVEVIQNQNQMNNNETIQKNAIFMENLEIIEIITQWLLLLTQNEDEEVYSDQELEKQQQITEHTNQIIKNILKSKINSLKGVIRNSVLSFENSEVICQLSWRVIRNSLNYINNDQQIFKLSFLRIRQLLKKAKIEEINNQLISGNTEVCLEIIFTIVKKNIKNIAAIAPLLNQILNFAKYILFYPSLSNQRSIMVIFQLISLRFNPEKLPVTQEQNRELGLILKQFLLNNSDITLQCQCLDTLFDVYSNEMFDTIFKQYGYMVILEQGLKKMKGLNIKTKFFKEVLMDLKRFLQYKRDQLQKQNLL